MLSEIGRFLVALVFLLLTFGSAISVLEHPYFEALLNRYPIFFQMQHVCCRPLGVSLCLIHTLTVDMALIWSATTMTVSVSRDMNLSFWTFLNHKVLISMSQGDAGHSVAWMQAPPQG